MRVMVTGAGGFVGSHLVPALIAAGHDLDCPNEFRMNLRFSEQVEERVRLFQPEIVIHLAAKTEVAFSFDDYEDFQRVNYLGTVLLAEANRRFNPELKQFIFASTMETYGHQFLWSPFTEHTPQRPMAPYAVAKLACEKYLDYMGKAYRFPSTILRQTNAYGRTNTTFFVMERIISQMLLGEKECRLGDPAPQRNFLFIDDLVELYMAAIGNENAIGQTFVTGPDNAISINDLAWACKRLLGYQGEFKWYTIPARPGEILYLNSRPMVAKAALGWEPKTELDAGILLTAERMKASVPGLYSVAA